MKRVINSNSKFSRVTRSRRHIVGNRNRHYILGNRRSYHTRGPVFSRNVQLDKPDIKNIVSITKSHVNMNNSVEITLEHPCFFQVVDKGDGDVIVYFVNVTTSKNPVRLVDKTIKDVIDLRIQTDKGKNMYLVDQVFKLEMDKIKFQSKFGQDDKRISEGSNKITANEISSYYANKSEPTLIANIGKLNLEQGNVTFSAYQTKTEFINIVNNV